MQNDDQMSRLALQFLERVDLKGAETPAYNAVVAWVSQKGQAPVAEAVPEERSAKKA